jgi:Zn-finger nucleic acid-binding protein
MTNDDDYKIQERADDCLTFEEAREAQAKGLEPAEYVEVKYGVNPAEYADGGELEKAMRQSRRGEPVTASKSPESYGASAAYDRQTEDMCRETLSNEEIKTAKAQKMLPTQFIQQKYGLDGKRFGSAQALEAAMSQKRRDGDVNLDRHRSGSTWVSS